MYQKKSTGIVAGFGNRLAVVVIDKWLNGSVTDAKASEFLKVFFASCYEDQVQKDVQQRWELFDYMFRFLVTGYARKTLADFLADVGIKGTEMMLEFMPDYLSVRENGGSFYRYTNNMYWITNTVRRSLPRFFDRNRNMSVVDDYAWFEHMCNVESIVPDTDFWTDVFSYD